MTCNDCISCDVCYKADGCKYIDEKSIKSDCFDFKNKADFVEVVRCRECKFAYENRFLGVTYCEMTDHKIKQHHFCSYGERRDT